MSALRLSGALREVRIVLCQHSAASAGAREFVSQNYVELKTENPTTPILVRECSDVQPMLYARWGLDSWLLVHALKCEHIFNLHYIYSVINHLKVHSLFLTRMEPEIDSLK